jgi:hypothetical protein
MLDKAVADPGGPVTYTRRHQVREPPITGIREQALDQTKGQGSRIYITGTRYIRQLSRRKALASESVVECVQA